MKKTWKKPELEVLDVSMTMKGFGPPKKDWDDWWKNKDPGEDSELGS
ncbi:paeninodin family lasso peptide [Jeotgalibacillus soli]|uniref:Paeninodin family lasso peptide n=1 Tax=Jeotgalibacillus soli TaxID=889306 RepID=A0A0C2VY45_9BACL|nr:paeninodin family lasso peptide [Jeotgalibacillus soli]KIL49341.1 hypothetical protein KP78_08090 [Jeotgalibacillus soli]